MINFGWKFSFDPKVHQRAVNKVARTINKSIEDDNLWQGRFFIHQWSREPITYEDGSGMYLALEMRLYDKATNKYVRWFCDSHDMTVWGGSKAWQRMNDFIVNDLDVWTKEPELRNESKDWCGVPQAEVIKTATPLHAWDY